MADYIPGQWGENVADDFVAKITDGASDIGTALRGALVSIVGSRATPVTDPATPRPDTTGVAYWLCATGVTPANAAAGDLIWNASA